MYSSDKRLLYHQLYILDNIIHQLEIIQQSFKSFSKMGL